MKHLFIVPVAFFLSTSFAIAGGVDGGGGKSIVCRDSSGKVKSAEVLDLYEARVMFGLNIVETNVPMDQQIKEALQRVPEGTRELFDLYVGIVKKGMRLTPPGTELLTIDDSFEVITPRDCKAEQAANYFNDKLILINSDIWSAFSETGKAALILHEAIYATNRISGAKNSRQSRHIVANIFDPKTSWLPVKEGVPSDKLSCMAMTGGGLFMWAFKNPDQSWTLQFQILGNSHVVSKKTFVFSGQNLDLNEAKKTPILPGDKLVGNYDSVMGFAESSFEDGDIITITKRWENIKDVNTGQIIPGYQTLRYYFSWTSGTFPNTSTRESLLNCGVTHP